MANWKETVVIGDLHVGYQCGKYTVEEVGNQLADRLEQTRYKEDWELGDIIFDLRCVGDEDEYDQVLQRLYDFGDEDHRIWLDPLDGCGGEEEKLEDQSG